MSQPIRQLEKRIALGAFISRDEDIIKEAIVGYRRYEKIRRLNPREYHMLYMDCLDNDLEFDEEVDAL
jgi:hypothetical protein